MPAEASSTRPRSEKQGYHSVSSGIFFADGQPDTGLRLYLDRPLPAELTKGLRVLGVCAMQVQ